MPIADFVRAVFALILTLGLVGLAGVALRRFGPDAIGRLITNRKDRRLAVVESLVLDPARRLVLISCDGEERLLLLGEGQMLPGPLPGPKPKATVDA
jgi:flagellar protein FliO/FliZ